MLRKIYDWVIILAAHRHALFGLFLISFVESSIFPIPPDIMLIPMILAARNQAWKIAFVCTIASVLGGIGGYYIGYFLFEEFGRPILNFYHYYSQFEQLQTEYNKWGAWAVFVAGVSPFPYKVITILSGAIELNLFTFVIASVLARGLRFFVLAWLLWHFGDTVQDFIKRRLGILFTLFCVLLVGGFVIIKLI